MSKIPDALRDTTPSGATRCGWTDYNPRFGLYRCDEEAGHEGLCRTEKDGFELTWKSSLTEAESANDVPLQARRLDR